MKFYLFKKMPLAMGVLFLAYHRKFLVDRGLTILANKTMLLLAERYPRLSFLKGAAGQEVI